METNFKRRSDDLSLINVNFQLKSKSPTKSILFCLIMLLCITFADAQDEKIEQFENDKSDSTMMENYKPFKFGAHLKNMHTWHGFVVQSGPIFATNLEYNTRNKKFTFGFWGGSSFGTSGNSYKEFSIYAVYRFTDKFFTEIVTHNNYTGVEERGEKLHYWAYDKTTSYNFVDVNFGYNFNKFSVYYGIILFGQSQDVAKDSSGALLYDANGNLEDSWTNYAEVKATLYEKEGYKLSGFVGGAWSFHTDNTFYTQHKGNIINVGLALAKDVDVIGYKLPVEVTAMWNPEKQKTVLQLDITLF
ncbi:hypothetical protein [uncultured Winogradskyella sp.]|uniref:hypothetical protein n=1 Tax=uncultured Winogradskyella sp. TaxID=395353 RepID=UPI00262DA583|nr:hypothetical protein [uncultured Winogradskyella sp.]